jgi:purine-binding chemotaxis protein CheW
MPQRDKDVQSTLDWAAAYRRLDRLAAATEASANRTPEQEALLLEERARALARTPQAMAPRGSLLELVHFRCGEQGYALETRFVLEVLRAPELTPLPGAPAHLRGLTLLRGEALAVVELPPLFGRATSAAPGPVLVLGTPRPELGLRTDAVEQVRLLSRATLLPAPPSLSEREQALVSGIDTEGVIVLEGEALLGDSRLVFDLINEGSV